MGAVHTVHISTVGVIAAAAAFALVGCVYWRTDRRARTPDGATFASWWGLRDLMVKGPTRNRLILGRYRRSLVAAPERAATLIVGPSQLSGKSAGILIPALLELDENPVISTSVSFDVIDATLKHRSKVGTVKVFDVGGKSNLPSNSWSPIADAGTPDAARKTAKLLCRDGWENKEDAKQTFWRRHASSVLAAFLYAARRDGFSMDEVLQWATADPKEAFDSVRHSFGTSTSELQLLADLEAIARGEAAGQREGIYGQVQMVLEPWNRSTVRAATGRKDINADWLLSGANTLYIVGSLEDQREFSGIYGALLVRLLDDALAIAHASPGRRLDPTLILALDEICNVAPLPRIGEYASSVLKSGLNMITVIQDFSQAAQFFGAPVANSILAQHTTRVFCSGIGDPQTAEWVSRACGQRRVFRVTHSQGRSGSGQSQAENLEPLVSVERLRQAREFTALLLDGRHNPVWIRTRPWFARRSPHKKLVPPDVLVKR